jgi:protein ImuA
MPRLTPTAHENKLGTYLYPIMTIQLHSIAPGACPDPVPFEEVAAAQPQDMASAIGFALWRALEGARGDGRPVALIVTPAFQNERGRLFGWGARQLGLEQPRILLVRARREAEALWAFEETLKSGAVAAALGPLDAPSFVATRRLDFAARAGRAQALVLRTAPAGDLSAARLRWRVACAPSAPHPLDARAPGSARLTAQLARSRDGRTGAFTLEQDHETGRFRLVAGLADHGLAAQPDPGLRVA